MADDSEIVQKITIEVEGDKAADALKEIGDKAQSSFKELEDAAKTAGVSIDEFGKLSQRTQQQYVELSQRVQQGSQQIVQATQEVQQAAAGAGAGTKDLGGGLDEVSQKSGVSNREMRALGRVMKDFGAGEVAGLAFQLNKMLLVFGPIGVAMLALGEAVSFVKGKMKEMEDTAKGVTSTMATLAQKSADADLEKEATFWGMSVAQLKAFNAEADKTVEKMERIQKGSKELITADTVTQEKAFLTLLERHGIVINDVMADEGKLGKAFYQTGIEAARLYKNLSPIERLNLEKVLKGLGFTDEQIKSIEKGEAAFTKAYEAALKQKQIADQLAASWDRLNKLFLATSLGPPPVEDWSNFAKLLDGIGDIIESVIGWFKRIPPAVDQSIAQVKAAIEQLVTAPVGGAFRWIAEKFNDVVSWVGSKLDEAKQFVSDWVTTPIDNAWGWIIQKWNDLGSWFSTKIDEAKKLVSDWVTTPIDNAWQWIVDKWNAMLAKLGFKSSGGSSEPAPAEGKAAGGEVRGRPGTDTNLAWLTAGEYVIRREAVQRYGLGFLHAINAMRAPHFAGGGLVGIPAYAEGGQVGASNFLSSLEAKLHQVFDIILSVAKSSMDTANATSKGLFDFAMKTVETLRGISNAVQANFKSVDESLAKAADILINLGEGARKVSGKAGGGLIGGAGTGTSDSNLAWLSRGEYVVRADAVGRYGVGLFHALNNMIFPGFALGGLNIGLPRLATAGFAGGGMSNVTINFPGLPEITGLRAPSGVVDELRNAAAMAQVRSGGRKPSRYS